MTFFWVLFLGAIGGLLLLDLNVFHKEAHVVKAREALLWSLFWIFLSGVFAGGMYYFKGYNACLEFLAGYVIEKSLSIDNIFVFSLIFEKLSVPLSYQHRVLFWGIFGALLLRGLMIWLGISLITVFHPLIYILGIFLVFTGLKMFWIGEKEDDLTTHPLILFLHRYFPLIPILKGQKLWVRMTIDSKLKKRWYATPLFVALVLIEFSDLIFALDSIPAIFAITLDPFVVYTSNIFAILGLRSLYFLLADAIERFYYLKSGVAVVLCFVGLKMLLGDVYKFSTEGSLFLVLLILSGSVVLSFCQGTSQCRK